MRRAVLLPACQNISGAGQRWIDHRTWHPLLSHDPLGCKGDLSMNHLFATVIFGLPASLCWGSGDFSGGLASRRAYTGSVGLTDYPGGLVLLLTLPRPGQEPFPDPAALLGR